MVESTYHIRLHKGYKPIMEEEIKTDVEVTIFGKCRAETDRMFTMVMNIENINDYSITVENSDTSTICGVTRCCNYDFGAEAFGRKKPKFCPMCGKKIIDYL